jgi:hypothetical protein
MEFGLGYFPTYDGMWPGEVVRMAEERGHSAIYFPAEATRNIRVAGGGVPPRALRIRADLRRANRLQEAEWRGAIVVDAS